MLKKIYAVVVIIYVLMAGCATKNIQDPLKDVDDPLVVSNGNDQVESPVVLDYTFDMVSFSTHGPGAVQGSLTAYGNEGWYLEQSMLFTGTDWILFIWSKPKQEDGTNDIDGADESLMGRN